MGLWNQWVRGIGGEARSGREDEFVRMGLRGEERGESVWEAGGAETGRPYARELLDNWRLLLVVRIEWLEKSS